MFVVRFAFNGCILADSVGLGKTFTALAVIKYYELRNKSVLVLAPKKPQFTRSSGIPSDSPDSRERSVCASTS
jgi:ERCC4-related helicase